MRRGIIVPTRLAFGAPRALTTSAKPARESIPVSKGLPIIGNLLAVIRAGGAPQLHRHIDAQHRRHGEVFEENLGGNVRAVFISDPEVMRAVFAQEGKHPTHILPEAWTLYNELYGCARGLFFMNGAEWSHHRRAMNSFLLRAGSRASIQEAVACSAGNLDVRRWEANLEEALYLWSLDTITATMLGSEKYLRHRREIGRSLDEVSRKIKLIFETSARLQIIPIKLAHRFRLRVWRDFERAVDDALSEASDFAYALMKLCESRPPDGAHNPGVIDLMLQSRMAPSDIIRIVVDLVLAAGDTTAYTMQWILYCLARNPQYQKSAESRHIKNIIRETLRLYPVAPFITRINAERDVLTRKYRIPTNTLLIYSLFTVGRDARIFDRPDQFIPDRWAHKTSHMMQASLPFAMGARSCIGRQIAELQLAGSLKNILENFSIEFKNAQANNENDVILKMVSVPAKPIELKFSKNDPQLF